ncbi:MAG: hypothetical protein WD512_17315 [Candidatus Paceibacterota bacterium]
MNWPTKKLGEVEMLQNKQKINKWQKDIEEISKDVEDLLYSKYQAEKLEQIVRNNDFVKRNIGTFWTHYKLNLTYFLVIKIWHQIDEHPRSLSLIILLKNLLRNCKIFTKDWWTSQSKEGWLSQDEFKENFGDTHLDPVIVCNDIKDLEVATKKVEKMRHKRIAHTDKNRNLHTKIKYTEIIKAANMIEKITIKYLLLLTQSGRDRLTPIEDDWKIAFTQEWIKDES